MGRRPANGPLANGLLMVVALSAGLATAAWAREPSTAAGSSLAATVVSIGDGDTLRVRQAGRRLTVRLACLDAPELKQRPHGPAARDYLRQRLRSGRAVTLRVTDTDRYGRTVAEVISDTNVGLAMVEDGQAFVDRRFLATCRARDYVEAEARARRRRFGVWSTPGGITRPWDFRRGERSGLTVSPTDAPHRRA